MRNLLTGLTVAAALAFASSTQAADGLVDFSWNNCTPVVQDVTSSTPGIFGLFVSVIGMDVPQQGYETTFIYGDASGGVPDAWAFDPAGCQGSGAVALAWIAPNAVKLTCPSFQGLLASVQVSAVDKVPPSDQGTGYLGTNMRVTLLNTYPPGISTVLAATRYFLMKVSFDHSISVQGATTPGADCGNWANPICFKMTRANYLDMANLEHPFGRNVAPGAPLFVTFNGNSACGAVPNRPVTWGAIKNQYRN